MKTDGSELVFAVTVSSFTKSGFVGSASYGGRPVDLEFDDGDEGVFLTPEMCERLRVSEGSKLLLLVEDGGPPQAAESRVAGSASRPRISSARVYYAVGREGGAVLKIRED